MPEPLSVLANAEEELAFSIQCFEYGYRRAKQHYEEGKYADYVGIHAYLSSCAASGFVTIKRWVDLSTPAVYTRASEIYKTSFTEGYTEFLRNQFAHWVELDPTHRVRLFYDPLTYSFGYVIEVDESYGMYESAMHSGYEKLREAEDAARVSYENKEY